MKLETGLTMAETEQLCNPLGIDPQKLRAAIAKQTISPEALDSRESAFPKIKVVTF